MKRIVCVLLTLIMLLSLVPTAAFAASRSTSEAAITVLKQMTTLKTQCYHFNANEFRTGYGTVCNEVGHKVAIATGKPTTDSKVHDISQINADKALRNALKDVNTKVNNFATNNGLSLTQNEHDALVVFTYGVGDAWMNGTGTLKNVITKGTESTELVGALMQFGNEGRRLVEANMYLNGVYSNTTPTSIGKVTYDANGGSMAQGASYLMYFDTTKSQNHIPTPTMAGQKFIGWYTAPSGGTRIPVLTKDQAGKTLHAHYMTLNTSHDLLAADQYMLDVSYISPKTVYKNDVKTANPDKLNMIAGKTSVKVLAEHLDASGNLWCQLGSDAWVKVGAASTGYVASYAAQIIGTATVTNSYVNRRVNATASSAKNGSYKQGDVLNIIEEDGGWLSVGEVQADGTVEAVGWVSSIYTNWGSSQENAAGAQSTSVIGTAVVTFKGYLNVRQEPGTDAKIIGALAEKDTVELYEIKTVNGHQWGRTKTGWICLTYTKTTLLDNVIISDEGSKTYTFTAEAKVAITDVLVAAGTGNNKAQYKDYKDIMQDLSIKKEKAVSLSNLLLVDGETWAKATWSNDELAWKDTNKTGTKDVTATRSGWVLVNDTNFKLDPVKYTVSADTVNARTGAGNEFDMKFYLNKGSEVEVNNIALVGENIWGYITVILPIGSGAVGSDTGWINLASKYVVRGSLPADVDSSANTTSKIGTVINADSLRVRATGATYGAQIGRLSRGTTVAVWEENEDGWFKVDSNQNGTYDYDGDGWVSGAYLDVREGTVGGNSTVTDAAGNKYETDGTGKGVVANTYAGVNVRTGPSTAYASKGKLLPGTIVDILEVSGNGKWGRTAQGWVSLDYITMLSYNEALNDALTGNTTPEGGIQVESFDKAVSSVKTAVYTGTLACDNSIFPEPDTNATAIRVAKTGENVTVHELTAVTKTIEETIGTNPQTVTTKKTTTYWARVNDGWINLTSGVTCINLNALDEKVHTLVGQDELPVNGVKLKKGDQVKVTKLELSTSELKVMGRIETDNGPAMVDMSLFAEGAVYEAPKPQQNTNTNTGTNTIVPPTIGAGSSTGGFVTNTSGYRYTGNVIRTNELNVRANPSTTAAKTTTLKSGQALVVYETTTSEGMAWGRCDAGWVYLYYVDLVPATGAVDARVVAGDNVVAYTDMNCSGVAGTFARQSVIDIYEIVGKMARTDLGWVNVDNLL